MRLSAAPVHGMCCVGIMLGLLLCGVFGEPLAGGVPDLANETRRASEGRPLFAYVQIDKAGSSTMRVLITARAKYLNLTYFDTSEPCQTCQKRQRREVCLKRRLCKEFCRTGGPAAHSNPCKDQPSGAIVRSYYGYCGRLSRPCKYIVVLRDPLAQMQSSYSYFCLACSENKKFCGGIWDTGCPKLSLFAYARKFGNLYTRMFSNNSHLLDGGWYGHGYSQNGFTREVQEHHLHEALRTLKDQQAVITLALEDPKRLQRMARGLDDDPRWTNQFVTSDPHANKHEHESSEKLQELRHLLRFDIRLYNELFKDVLA
mmetsp:Transcript_119624/g.333823  ORF Transcript_119624/g.333823 Transcript_119624/m.333823 type:complete len:315 (-) Transcript_119624:62-1006(-)